MYIPDDKIEEVRAASDIVDIVGEYVQLKKRGSNFVGLCPFHDEKTPSFNVNPGRSIFKCFGCGVGGNVFQFIMRMENVGFPEAVRVLAERAGITLNLEQNDLSESASSTEAIYHALRFAARFYFDQLTQSEQGKVGLDYFKKRGFTGKTIKQFGLGYAPEAWDRLLNEAVKGQIAPEVLERAGLAIPRKDGSGYYDRYRGRVIFPIFSPVGKVLGFGGRILQADPEQPKYINSPETEVYSKSRVLYGLYQGKQAIRKAEEVILVEGYTDVISLHQAGVENAVAACGTSLTDGHVKSLLRYAKRIIFINDADSAGDNATVRGIGLALKGGLVPYVVELPEKEDPDSFVQKHGRETFEEYLRKYRWSFVQFLLIRARQDGRLLNPESEAQALNDVLELIATIDDPLVRDAYVHEMSDLLDKPDIILYSALEKVMLEQRRHETRAARHRVPAGPSHTPGSESLPGVDAAHGNEQLPERERTAVSDVLPEERILIRVMLEHGLPLVEFILGNMGLEEFTEGPARESVVCFLQQYQAGYVRAQELLDGGYGEAVQNFVADVLLDQHEPSENWERKAKIPVPRFNEDPYEAAASAMTLLKLDRVDELIQRVKQKQRQLTDDSPDLRDVLAELMELQTLRRQIEQREFLQWNKAE